MFQAIRAFVYRYERYVGATVFLGGFILDVLTLHFLTLSQIATLLGSYIGATAAAILIGHALIGERPEAGKIVSFGATLFPLIAQFFIGGALSGLVIMYSSSASFVASWPFIILLIGVFISTEAFSKYRSRLVFQSVLLFFTTYAYIIFTLPILLGAINRLVFILSSVLSVLLLFGFLALIRLVGKERVQGRPRAIMLWSFGIVVVLQLGYFFGIIPPLPLSLSDKGIYHAIERRGTEYALTGEPRPLVPFLTPTIHYSASTPLYAFSAVFAPARFSTHILHKWQRFDEASGSWVTKSEVELPVTGGRDGGYRTYSTSTTAREGRWRVAVTTPEGQVIGYIPFTIEPGLPEEVLTEVR